MTIRCPKCRVVHEDATDPLTALKALLEAEWMVTHDWGGDRDAVLAQAHAAVLKAERKAKRSKRRA